jgi:hypothetical protein
MVSKNLDNMGRFASNGRACRWTCRTPPDGGRRSANRPAEAQGFRHPCDGGDDTGHVGGDMRLDWRAEGLGCEITTRREAALAAWGL